MHKYIIISVVIILLGVGVFFGVYDRPPEEPEAEQPAEVAEPEKPDVVKRVVGTSVQGRNIETYTYGDGNTRLLLVGGIHGGYEWNTVTLSYQLIDYFIEHPEVIPENLTLTIIPDLNPDGTYAVVGVEGRFTLADVPEAREVTIPGRFNANDVDLNRNFDCKWKPESTWRGNVVSAGTEAFSEPEAQVLRNVVEAADPAAAVFFHSKGNAVYGSACEEGILPETVTVMHTYADAAGYPAFALFDAYEITGDAEGWLASIGIPGITVELSTHEIIEFEKNLAGVKALLSLYENGSDLSQ